MSEQFPDSDDGFAKLEQARQDGSIVKCWVIRCHRSKNIFGHVVPKKGVDEDNFVVNFIVQAISWMGHVKVILKSDNEKAILSLVSRALVTIRCQVENITAVTSEQSAKYDSQSNGGTEIGIRILRGYFRTHRWCLESRIGKVIPPNHPMTF